MKVSDLEKWTKAELLSFVITYHFNMDLIEEEEE